MDCHFQMFLQAVACHQTEGTSLLANSLAAAVSYQCVSDKLQNFIVESFCMIHSSIFYQFIGLKVAGGLEPLPAVRGEFLHDSTFN